MTDRHFSLLLEDETEI